MKPHEETLDVETIGEGKYIVHARSVIDPPDCARLLASAPAMARLLVSLGAMDVHDGAGHTGVYVCSWCDAESKNVEAVPHLHDCRLVAVLKAAGVVE